MVKYKYITLDGATHGAFECDIADFRSFLRAARFEIVSLSCMIDGIGWFWLRGVGWAHAE